MYRAFLAQLAMAALVLNGTAFGADPAASDAEQRAVASERRALEAERRALEAERRALEAQRGASAGAGRAPADADRQACQTATSNYQVMCAYPSRDPLWETPECAAAKAAMQQRCFAGR